jgi:hypothetical protein
MLLLPLSSLHLIVGKLGQSKEITLAQYQDLELTIARNPYCLPLDLEQKA